MNGNWDDDTAIQNDQERNKSGILQGVDQFSNGAKSGFNADRDTYGKKEKGDPKGLNGIKDDKINKHDQKDIDSINNRGKNGTDINGKKEKGSKDDEPEKKENKKDNKDDLANKDKNKDAMKDNAKDQAKDKAKDKAAKETVEKASKSKSAMLLKIKIYFWIAVGILAIFGVIFIVAFLFFTIGSFTGATSTYYGVSEDDSKEGAEDGLYTNDKYLEDKDGNAIGWKDYTDENGVVHDGLITILQEDDKCKIGSDWLYFWDNFLKGENSSFSDVCQLLRYIRGNIEDYEQKYSIYNLNIDEGAIIGTLFYGYDQQAPYSAYSDGDTSTEFIPAAEHYQVLKDIIDNNLIHRKDIDRMIQNTIFEQVYPYFTWSIVEEEANGGEDDGVDSNNIRVGICTQLNQSNYFSSMDKYKMFLRWNDERDGEDSANAPEARMDNTEFSVPGYMGLNGKKVLDRELISVGDSEEAKQYTRNVIDKNNRNFLNLYGSGWVYDDNMNNSWTSTSEECNGTYSAGELMAAYDLDELRGYDESSKFYKDRNITDVVDTTIYFQKVEDIFSTSLDVFESREIQYTTKNISPSTYYVDFDYIHGYSYINFPGFKKAIDKKLDGFIYDEVLTPKKIETIIEEIMIRKDEYDEVLLDDVSGTSQSGTSGYGYGGVVGAYCEEYLSENTANINVELSDCSGQYITTVSFAEYIMGVTYAEIDYPSNDNYVLTQMVAAISFSLARNNNYQNGNTIRMKSGSCDQNWCSTSQGCHRKDTKHANGKTYGSTYPGASSSGKYYKDPLSSSQLSRYSALYNQAAGYLIVDNSTNKIRGGSYYTSTTQVKWSDLASSGKSFLDILKETYPNTTIADCTNLPSSILDGNTDWSGNVNVNVPDPTESQAQWGNRIVQMATDLVNNHNKDFCYISPGTNDKARINTYNDIKTNGYLQADCNAFVGYVIHHALGIGPEKGTTITNTTVAGPSGNSWSVRGPYSGCVKVIQSGLTLDQALSAASPGDILASVGDGGSHIQIYAGNGVVIDNANAGGGSTCGHPLTFRTKSGHPSTKYKIMHQGGSYTILRVTSLSC